jgi:hypothetical protein
MLKYSHSFRQITNLTDAPPIEKYNASLTEKLQSKQYYLLQTTDTYLKHYPQNWKKKKSKHKNITNARPMKKFNALLTKKLQCKEHYLLHITCT